MTKMGQCVGVMPLKLRSRNVNVRTDISFNEPTGPTVHLRENTKAMDLRQFYFTDAVWNLIVEQTNLNAEQKRGPNERLVWYPVTVDEMKA